MGRGLAHHALVARRPAAPLVGGAVSVTPGQDPGAGEAIVRAGFRRDPAHRRAALIAFVLTFIIALVSVWPAWRWWAAALEYAPRGDSLIDRVDLVVLKELVQFDRSSAFGMTGAALSAGACSRCC